MSRRYCASCGQRQWRSFIPWPIRYAAITVIVIAIYAALPGPMTWLYYQNGIDIVTYERVNDLIFSPINTVFGEPVTDCSYRTLEEDPLDPKLAGKDCEVTKAYRRYCLAWVPESVPPREFKEPELVAEAAENDDEPTSSDGQNSSDSEAHQEVTAAKPALDQEAIDFVVE